jgi:hypothetical protein
MIQLNEGLMVKDLKDYVSDIFTVDKYRSKMGEDSDVVVLGFKVKDKYPAIDLMEFLERGYKFILDADMSAGEENDGQYQVFVEIPRTSQLPEQLQIMLNGVSQLTDNYSWKFRYQKSHGIIPFSKEKIMEHVPLDKNAYGVKVLEIKNNAVSKFLNQGALESVVLDKNDVLTVARPYSGKLKMKFLTLGKYDQVKTQVPGAISLDENSQSEVLFLEKYLGNYEIHKIQDKFLIKNGSYAMLVQKETW